MRLLGHEKLCQVAKDPLKKSGDAGAKIRFEKIFVCQRCHCTGYNALLMFSHLRRCTKNRELPSTQLGQYLCGACRIRTLSLGEVVTHLEQTCPILHAPVVKLEETASEDVVILDSEED